MLELLERDKRETTREYVIRVLRHNIINLNLKPGQFVSENEIAEILGVSRTPVREAFIELSKSALVEIYPQKGTCIAPIDMDVVEESRFMRCVLEKAVIQLACDKISDRDITKLEDNLQLQETCLGHHDPQYLLYLDDKFHEYLFEICNKKMTYNLIKSAVAQFDRVRILNYTEMDMNVSVNEHRELLEAIRRRDKELATELMEKHLTRVIYDMSYLKEKHPEYFKGNIIKVSSYAGNDS